MNSEIKSEEEKLNQIKPKIALKKIKSDYILKKLFNMMEKYISLKIIRYNKNLQKRLNISIEDYKLYSTIEIELKIKDNDYGHFINISNKEEEKYYHIYFDNSNE